MAVSSKVRSSATLQLVLALTCAHFAEDMGGPSLRVRAERNLATATWYGTPTGDGSDAGACGYGPLARTPYGSMIFAGSPPLFQDGAACGQCFQVNCVGNSACSPIPITITMTDLCPGGDRCGGDQVHFDLSGFAFGKMALAGQEEALRAVGVVQVQYTRVPCSYPEASIVFQVNAGTNPYYLSLLVRNADGPGAVGGVTVQLGGTASWRALTRDWGANWILDGVAINGPIRVRVTASGSPGAAVTCPNAIPTGFSVGTPYECGAQIPRHL